MHVPFVCTNNSLGTIDYGMPIVARKSTDYRTATGSSHRYIPNVAQEFDCRVKARIKPSLLTTDVAIRDQNVVSDTGARFNWKFPQKTRQVLFKAPRAKNVNFARDVQERVFKNPPPPKEGGLSEMKDAYFRNGPCIFNRREVWPPEPYAKCEIKALGRDEQPALKPEEQGYYKWLDPYLTTTRGTHVPFTKDQQDGLARKDIITFYDIAKYPKAKGFGPRNGTDIEPLVPRRKIPMTNRIPFKLHPTNRRIYEGLPRLPHSGRVSEYKTSYKQQSFSDMSPYLFQNGVVFPEPLSNSSAWQDLAAPGMYCSEYCHTGTAWPVNSLIDYGLPTRYPIHPQCFTKFCDWSQ